MRGTRRIVRLAGVVAGWLALAPWAGWGQQPLGGIPPAAGAPRPALNAPHHAWVHEGSGRFGFVPMHERIAQRDAGHLVAVDDEPSVWVEAPTTGLVQDGMPPGASAMAGPVEVLPGPLPDGPLWADPGYGAGPVVDVAPGPGYRMWFRGQYLLWWTRGVDLPVLLTTSPADTDRDIAGELGQPSTSVVLGGDQVFRNSQSGWELNAGFWLDPNSGRALTLRVLGLGPKKSSLTATSDQFPILARPFLDIAAGEPSALLIGYPNFVDGRFRFQTETEFYMVDGAADWPLCFTCGPVFRWQIGYRYGRLNDDLLIQQATIARSVDTGVPPGTTVSMRDRFRTQNDFNGALIGIAGQKRHGCWSLELLARLGIGATRGEASLEGRTVTTVEGEEPAVTSGGLLVQPTNDGVFRETRFAMMPELGAQLHYDMPCNMRFSFGYTFLYWSQVMRAADHIDQDVNLTALPPNQLTGAARPRFDFQFNHYWAQGLNFGLEYRY